jgi:hypothetical protein
MPNHARAFLMVLSLAAAASVPATTSEATDRAGASTDTRSWSAGQPAPPIGANTPVEPLVPGTDTASPAAGAPAPVSPPPAVSTPATGPSPAAGVPATPSAPAAASAPAVETGTRTVESGARKAGQGISETARGIGQTVVEGTKVASTSVAGAAVTTGRTIGDAGKAVGRGAKTAWEVTRDGVIDLADSVVNFVARPF